MGLSAAPAHAEQSTVQQVEVKGALAANVRREHFSRTVHNVEEHVDPADVEDGLRLGRLPESGHITLLNLSPRLIWNLENGDNLTSQTFVNLNHFENDVTLRATLELKF